ncbi:MAG: CoA transferase [Ilumatobacteraceae bacterium]|nr:CoA transferase [Ilumatobacteraceae bacterium]
MDTSSAPQQPQRPLQGLRILDFSRVLTGPHATRMLCDLGAEIIKIEPPDGDLTRFTNPRVNSLSTYFIQQNAGKKNISLDMSKPEAVAIVKQLVMHADILIENFRPGVMKKLGLDYASLSALNPKLIYASITGYGQTGPWVHRRAYAPVVGAESGLTNHQGMARGGQFANDPFSHADVYTAMETCAAVLAAVIQRHSTGRGQSIDIAMAQTMLYVNEHAHDALWDEPTPPEWIRSFEPGNYPVLTAANGDKVVVSGHPGERGTFDLFFTAIGRTDLLTNPKFADVPSRLTNLEELQNILRAWALTIPDATAIEEALAKHKLASGKIRTTREFADTDWAAAREITVEVSNRGGGKVRIPNAPWKFSDATVTTAGSPKYRGEDNALVLGELLGLSAAEVDALTEAGVLQRRVPPGATP